MTIDGGKIKTLRKEKGYTVRDLASLSGVHKNTLHDIEHNRANPTLDTINKIAKALNVDPQKLFLGGE